MKNPFTIFFLFFCIASFSQEKIKHRYNFRSKILYPLSNTYQTKEERKKARKATIHEHRRLKKATRILKKNDSGTVAYNKAVKMLEISNSKPVVIMRDSLIPYQKLDTTSQKKIKSKLNLVKNNISEHVELISLDKTKITIHKEQATNEKIYESIAMEVPRPAKFGDFNYAKYKGDVLFEKNKLFINPWNFTNRSYTDTKKELYYPMKDGQSIKLNFRELTLTTLTLPLKYRFGKDPIMVPKLDDNNNPILDEQMMPQMEKREIPETFTTSINVSVYFGVSFGRTNFLHRNKVGNRTVTHKHTVGVLVGTTAETLTTVNTDGSDEAPKKDESLTIGLFSPGFGYVYSRNKFSVGGFIGLDIGIGSISNTWNYDNNAWLGVGIGYEIFKL